MQAISITTAEPIYAPFVDACVANGISRSVAYELESDGLLETFLIGRRKYVYLSSLRDLPRRIAERDAKEAA